jgi:hypothetical protein
LGKIYSSIWLRESYRDNGKVKTRNLLNLKDWPEKAIDALQAGLNALKNTPQQEAEAPSDSADNPSLESAPLKGLLQQISIEQGLSVGALFTVFRIAQRLGIVDAFGSDIQGKLALWQLCARVLEQGSRLSAARMANLHAAASILQFEQTFSENNLYDNLRWLDQNQTSIEDRLFAQRSQQKTAAPGLFLDLSLVESAFRTCKTVTLELRPLYVRLSSSTRGHAFVVMLGYMIIQELNRLWKEMNVTVSEGLSHLSTLTETRIVLPNGVSLSRIPGPTSQNAMLLKAAGIELPACLTHNNVVVRTYTHRKKTP